MQFQMQKANFVADSVLLLIEFVNNSHQQANRLRFNPDKVYQLKLLTEEYQLQSLAEELRRINLHTWDERYSFLLMERIENGMSVIEEFVQRHYDELFVFSAKLYTIKNACAFLIGTKDC